jgi:predicted molibdopterin-dependent oxidoreductase YjgC
VQRIRRALNPPENLIVDGEILVHLAKALKAEAAPFDARKVFDAIAASVPAYAGMTLAKLGSQGLAPQEPAAAPAENPPAAPAAPTAPAAS